MEDEQIIEKIVTVPALPHITNPKRNEGESYDEYQGRRYLMKKAQHAMDCYGVTEAGLKLKVSLNEEGKLIDILDFVGIARFGGNVG